MKGKKAIMPMRCVNANPGKYVSIITNFGCHYTCPECIVRNNGLKMSETDHFSTQEPLNKVLCKERPEERSLVILRGSFPHGRTAKRQVGNAHELSPG